MIETFICEGACACGTTRFRLEGQIVAMAQCWCLDCQKETGGGPTHSVIVASEAVTFESGGDGEYVRTSDRGSKVRHRFCAVCANVLTADVDGVPFSGVRVGTLADRSFYRPQMVLYAASAPPWARFPDNAQLFDTQPAAAA